MNFFPNQIQINGRITEVERLFQETLIDKADWEKEWLEFLAEWYSPSESIKVKTSGSTGKPKTINLKKDFVAASALRTIHYFQLNKYDRVLHCLPSRYIAGKLMIVRGLLGRLDLHLVDPSTDFEVLRTHKFKFAAMVPNQVQKIMNGKIRNLESLLIGGSAVPRPLEEQLQRVETKCYSSYSMTETATHIALRKINSDGADGFYHCLDGIHVGLSPAGCLQVFMQGLKEYPLQTTDLAELSDVKTFKIKGRSDHIIISGGMKFSPEQIERKLERHIPFPFMIASQEHETLGEQVVLVVEAAESLDSVTQLFAICQQQLDRYEVPKKISFVDEIPQTPTGKVDRNRL